METVEVRFGRGDKRRTLGWWIGDRYQPKFVKVALGVIEYDQHGEACGFESYD